jgi:hypothetical protein
VNGFASPVAEHHPSAVMDSTGPLPMSESYLAARRPSQVPWTEAEPARPAMTLPTNSLLVQRCGGHPCPPEGCEQNDHTRLLPSRVSTIEEAVAPPSVQHVLGDAGTQLPTQLRAEAERLFNRSFATVRIHTDSRAAESARAIGASAYTAGFDIAFAEGEYRPDTERGRRLLAHELTHVSQQPGSASARIDARAPLLVEAADSALEHEATSVASSVHLTGEPKDLEVGHELHAHDAARGLPNEDHGLATTGVSEALVVRRQSGADGGQSMGAEGSAASAPVAATDVPRGRTSASDVVLGTHGDSPCTATDIAQTRGDLRNQVDNNVETWIPFTLRAIPKLVGMLFETAEDVIWWTTFGVKVLAEVLEGIFEAWVAKLVIQGLMESFERMAEKQLEKAKEETEKQVEEYVLANKIDKKEAGYSYIEDELKSVAKSGEPCAAAITRMRETIVRRWPPIGRHGVEEVDRIVSDIIQKLQAEKREEVARQARMRKFNECIQIALRDWSGGTPSPEQEKEANARCRLEAGLPAMSGAAD